ncbi:unnamed protein product [Sympodiomycopsis kandeliae]
MSTPLPDYYALLGVPSSATSSEIREAYKKQSLTCHPDRFPNASSGEKQRLTRKFQSLADAYYVLSDPERKSEYDGLRSSQGFQSFTEGQEEKEQDSSANFFSQFFRAAGSSTAAQDSDSHAEAGGQPEAEGVFNNVFEEMLRPEVHRVAPVWKWVGSASGAALGMILANIPGAVAGTFVGGKLGAIRDAKGKSVSQVFMNLNAGQRAEVLKALATKVLGSLG